MRVYVWRRKCIKRIKHKGHLTYLSKFSSKTDVAYRVITRYEVHKNFAWPYSKLPTYLTHLLKRISATTITDDKRQLYVGSTSKSKLACVLCKKIISKAGEFSIFSPHSIYYLLGQKELHIELAKTSLTLRRWQHCWAIFASATMSPQGFRRWRNHATRHEMTTPRQLWVAVLKHGDRHTCPPSWISGILPVRI